VTRVDLIAQNAGFGTPSGPKSDMATVRQDGVVDATPFDFRSVLRRELRRHSLPRDIRQRVTAILLQGFLGNEKELSTSNRLNGAVSQNRAQFT
jgi:hypothetical protein